MNTRTAIIIPVHNALAMTKMSVERLTSIYRLADVSVIIIDNASTDDTPGYLERLEHVDVIHNEQNMGYAYACNQGANRAAEIGADLLIFLNNDVVIGGDFVAIIDAVSRANPGDVFGANLIAFDTGWNRFGDDVVPYLEGWCIACRRDTFDALGGFDERYTPCDYEDVDLSMVATVQGRRLRRMSLPLVHIGNQTGRLLESRVNITRRNRDLFYEKWFINRKDGKNEKPERNDGVCLPETC